jgi:hypothetical protein
MSPGALTRGESSTRFATAVFQAISGLHLPNAQPSLAFGSVPCRGGISGSDTSYVGGGSLAGLRFGRFRSKGNA